MVRFIALILAIVLSCSFAIAAEPTSAELEAWQMAYDLMWQKFDLMQAAQNACGSTIAMGHSQIDSHEYQSGYEYSNPHRRDELHSIEFTYLTADAPTSNECNLIVAGTDSSDSASVNSATTQMLVKAAECIASETNFVDYAGVANAIIALELGDWSTWLSLQL
jgi:opacity protein-like surface antigen